MIIANVIMQESCNYRVCFIIETIDNYQHHQSLILSFMIIEGVIPISSLNFYTKVMCLLLNYIIAGLYHRLRKQLIISQHDLGMYNVNYAYMSPNFAKARPTILKHLSSNYYILSFNNSGHSLQ